MPNLVQDPDFRLVQIFIGENGVYEVFRSLYTDDMLCTCPGGVLCRRLKNRVCKHVRTVEVAMASGTYNAPLVQEEGVDADLVRDLCIDAREDPVAWAGVIRRYLVPQVL